MSTLLRLKRPHAANEGGFTVIELLVYLMIAAVMVASIYQLLIGQNRLYMKQRELTDVRSSLRAAAALLSWELRQAAATEGDIYTIATNSVALRSVQGTGIICGEHSTLLRYALWGTSGEFSTTADDSALVFAAGSFTPTDDQWKVVKVTGVFNPVAGGVALCALGDVAVGKGKGSAAKGGGNCKAAKGCKEIAPDLVVEIAGNIEDVYVGAAFRAFRHVEYGLFQEDGRWWLGRKVGAAASYEKLTGPLRSPTDSGLVLTYYDQAGNVTADSTQVALIEIRLRGESFGTVRKNVGDVSVQQDTLTTWVSLRG